MATWATPVTASTGGQGKSADFNNHATDLAWLKLACPIGLVLPYAASAAPTGWLVCDGSALSRTTYSDLFAVIGTTYGAGNGSTTFNLPDVRGRVVLGVSGTHALASTGGEENHTLTAGELPSHTHNVEKSDQAPPNDVAGVSVVMGHTNSPVAALADGIGGGGGGSHNNMPPFIAMTAIIFAGNQ